RCFLADNLRVAHRPNDANNGLPRRIVPIANALAQGVLMGPILAGKIFIDNGHRLAAVAVLIGEDTSTEQANAHRLEIARPNAAVIKPWGRKPMSTSLSFCKLFRNTPALASSSRARESSATTSPLRKRWRPALPSPVPRPCFRFWCGSRKAICHAGAAPKMM